MSNELARGGVRITFADGKEAVVFYNLNAQIQLEVELTALRKAEKRITLQEIMDELRFNYSAELGRFVLWFGMKHANPAITIEEAGEYPIDEIVKALLMLALNNTRFTQAEYDRYADDTQKAMKDQVESFMAKAREGLERADPTLTKPGLKPFTVLPSTDSD